MHRVHARNEASGCNPPHVWSRTYGSSARAPFSQRPSSPLARYAESNYAVTRLSQNGFSGSLAEARFVNMRYLWMIAGVVAIVAIVAVVAPTLLPYTSFQLYVHQLPLSVSDPHYQDSVTSLDGAVLATLCALLPVSAMALICPAADLARPHSTILYSTSKWCSRRWRGLRRRARRALSGSSSLS